MRSQPTACSPAFISSRAGKFRTRRPSGPSTASDTIPFSGSVRSIARGGVSLATIRCGTGMSPRSVNTCSPLTLPHRSPAVVASATNFTPRVETGGNVTSTPPASFRGSCLIRAQSCGPATAGLMPGGPR